MGFGVGVGVGVGLGVGLGLAAWAAGAVITSAIEAPMINPSEALRILFLFIVSGWLRLLPNKEGGVEGEEDPSERSWFAGLGRHGAGGGDFDLVR